MIQTKNRGKYRILPGNPEKMGASATKDGYNFAVEVSDGKKAELLLYRKGHQKPFLTVPLLEEERTGVISSVEITGLTVRCTDGKRRGRLLLPSPGVPGNAHHLTAPAV